MNLSRTVKCCYVPCYKSLHMFHMGMHTTMDGPVPVGFTPHRPSTLWECTQPWMVRTIWLYRPSTLTYSLTGLRLQLAYFCWSLKLNSASALAVVHPEQTHDPCPLMKDQLLAIARVLSQETFIQIPNGLQFYKVRVTSLIS